MSTEYEGQDFNHNVTILPLLVPYVLVGLLILILIFL